MTSSFLSTILTLPNINGIRNLPPVQDLPDRCTQAANLMNNPAVQKLVQDFESAASQPNHSFAAFYQDLRSLQEDAPNIQTYSQEIIQVNQDLSAAGAIPNTPAGLPEFVILGADAQGDIITANAGNSEVQYRNQNMAVSDIQMVGEAKPFSASDFYQDAPSASQSGGDSTATSQPAAPQAPETEEYGGRTFDVQPDGSAQYTVVSGDTVWAVAQSYLEGKGDPNPSNAQIEEEVDAIAQASQLANPNLIYPGNILTVPGPNGEIPSPSSSAGRDAVASDAGSASAQPAASGGSTYDGATGSGSSSQVVSSAADVVKVAQSLGLNQMATLAALGSMLEESGGNPGAVGDGGNSFGLFQLNDQGELLDLPGNLQQQEAEAMNPTTNAGVALQEFKSLQGQYSDPGQLAAAAQRPANRSAYAQAVDANQGQAQQLYNQVT